MRRLIVVVIAGLLVLGPAVGASEAQDDLLQESTATGSR